MSRGFREKFWQFSGIPQGIGFAVGLVTLIFQQIEHEYYVENPETRNEFAAMRWLDDSII